MPSLSSYVAQTPVEEQPVAPVDAAQTPVESAPAPPPQEYQGGGLGEYAAQQNQQQDYTAAPEAPPSNFIPGSTYRPMPLADQADQKAVEAPIPTLTQLAPESSVPTDPFSGFGDVLGTARDAAARGDIKGVATTFLDAASLPMQQVKNQVSERAKDQAIYGDANRTTDLSLQGLKDHPENLNPALLTTSFINEFEGMPDWVPSDTTQQINEFYNDPVEGSARQAEAQEREKTEGVGAWYNTYMDAQHMTLDTGGLGGLVRGGLRDVGADPASYLSAGFNAGGEAIATGARNAGMIGVARGTEGILRGGNIILDPLTEGGIAGGKSLAGYGKKWLPGVFGQSEKVGGQIASEKVIEAVNTGVQDIRRQNDIESMLGPAPPEFNPPEPAMHGPFNPTPEGPPIIQYDAPVEPQRLAGPSPYELLPGPHLSEITPEAVAERSRLATNTKAAEEAVNPTTPPVPTRTPSTVTSNLDKNAAGDWIYGRELVIDPIDGKIRWKGANAPTVPEMERAMGVLSSIKTDDFVPMQYGWQESQHSLMRGAMTQSNFMLDDWGSARVARERAAGRAVSSEKIAAGRRYVDMLSTRISNNKEREVQRIIDAIQSKQYNLIQAQPDMDPYLLRMNTRQLFESVAEAAEKAGFKRSFSMEINGHKFTYFAKDATGELLQPRRSRVGAEFGKHWYDNPLRSQVDGRNIGFVRAGDDTRVNEFFMSLGIPNQNDLWGRMSVMLRDPDAFMSLETAQNKHALGEISDNRLAQIEDYNNIRKFLYREEYGKSGQKIWAKRGTTGTGKWAAGNEAHGRYSLFQDEWRQYTKDWDAGAASDPVARTADLVDPGTVAAKLDELKTATRPAETGAPRIDPEKLAAIAKRPAPAVKRLEDGTLELDTTPPKDVEFGPEAPKGYPLGDKVEGPPVPAWKPDGNPWGKERPRITPGSADDPWKNTRVTAENYPHLFAKMEASATSQGKKSLWGSITSSDNKVRDTRMRMHGDTDIHVDPEFENSGMSYGMQALFHQIDTDMPLVVDGQKVQLYSYIKQVSNDVQALTERWNKIDPANVKEQKQLVALKKKYDNALNGLDPENLTDAEKDMLTTAHITSMWAEQHVPKSAPNRAGLIGDIGKAIKNVVDFRRSVGLTNLAAAPRQFLNQLFGNVWGLYMGKPSAVLDMGNMRDLWRHIEQLNVDPNAKNTLLQDMMQGFGADAPNTMISSQAKTLAGHEVDVNGVLGRLRDFVAPKRVRNAVSAPDELAKGGVGRVSFARGMSREVDNLPVNARLTAARMGTKREGLGVVAAQIEKKLPQILDQYKGRGLAGRPSFTGEELEKGIIEAFLPDVKRGTVNRESLRVYADRMKRDWNSTINSEKQYAASEVRRVMFSWDNTKADDLIQNVFLYHYWATRAGFLYSKEMLKKPYMITMYMNAAGQMQQEAEAGDYPDWLKGFTRVLNTPAGVALFMNPLDMIGTAFHLNEMEMGANDDAGVMTALGRAKGMIPFVWNPAIELALSYAGAFGPGVGQPNNMLGLNRMTSMAADVLNWANYQGLLGPLGKDANGNPIPIPPRPLDDVILRVASHFGMPVVPSLASYEKETDMYLTQNIVDEYGVMDAVELNAMKDDMYKRARNGDLDPMLYNAQADALGNGMQGPDGPLPEWVPEGLRSVFGAVVRYTSPVRMTARSEMGAKIQYPGMVNTLGGDPSIQETMTERGDNEFAVKGVKNQPFMTERRRSLDVAYQEWYDGGNPELAAIDDEFYNIGHNTASGALNVGGVDYSLADMNAMSDKERWNLAEDWLAEQGYSRSDLDAMQDYKDELIQKNPDIGGYIAFQNYMRDYPGGPNAFVDEAVKTSPSFAAFMADHGTPGTPEYYEFTTTKDAYFAIMGERSGVYDPENVPPQGNIPGLPAGTNFIVKYQTDKQIDDAIDGGSNSFKDFVNTVTTDSNQIYAAQQWLDTNYPGVIADGDIPYDIYKAMKAAGVTAPKLEDASAAYEYRGWLRNNATATDLSIEAFLDQRDSTGTSPEDLPLATPEMIAAQGGYEVRQSAPISRDELQSIGIASTMAQYSPLYTGPGTNNAISFEVPSGLPGVKEIYRDSGGWSQVYVPVAGGGYKIGWVPTQALAAA